MKIERFYDINLSHASYAIVSDHEMALIDPAGDPQPYYVNLARGYYRSGGEIYLVSDDEAQLENFSIWGKPSEVSNNRSFPPFLTYRGARQELGSHLGEIKIVAMKINTKMPSYLVPPYKSELESYRKHFSEGNYALAWNHLERAHIIGQAFPYAHTQVHWLMLKFGLKIKDRKEIFGQIPRLLVGGVKSFVGKIPVGNTGGANVPPLRSLPIAEDLQEIMRPDKL